ncbi:MAG: CDP-glycerol glycerophosphotransferase family protein [Calditrichaceae bacterium]|nr:CDP-glycerol glycerophosphotransferase family protein [Calditrichaceae bacterium]
MKYLFYIAKAYSIPIIQPLAQYLDKQEADYRFYVSEKVRDRKPEDWHNEKILTRLKDARQFKPDFVLCPGNFVDFRIPGKKVQLFHGLGVEKAVHYKIRHFFDVYLTSGPYVTERFRKLQDRYGNFLIRETGWPKIDYILNYPAQNIRKKLNLPENKKIVLYAPTFSVQHESASSLTDIIPQIMKDDEFWIFKFHELMDTEVIQAYRALDKLKALVLTDAEITPYLHASDVMISDTSSVIYEYMVLDKPIITFRTQARPDKGIDIKEADELRPALDRCFNNPVEFKVNRQRHLAEINPYLDGKISGRVFRELEQISNENIKAEKRKPINLFRKMQVVYHSMFRPGYLR